MEHRVYTFKLGSSWKRRVAHLEGAELRIEKPQGKVELLIAQEDSVVVEAAETALMEGKITAAAKLQDMLKVEGSPEELLKSMLSITWLGETGNDTCLVCFGDTMMRDIWLRRTQDILAPSVALNEEVAALKTELRFARTDLQRTSFLHSDVDDGVFEVGATGYLPRNEIHEPNWSHIPTKTPKVAEMRLEGRLVTRTPVEPGGGDGGNDGVSVSGGGSGGGMQSDAQAVLLQGLLTQLDVTEQSVKDNIARLGDLHTRFDRAATDAASWRMENRLASDEAIHEALKDVRIR